MKDIRFFVASEEKVHDMKCVNTWPFLELRSRLNLEAKVLKAVRIAKDHVTADSISRKTNL